MQKTTISKKLILLSIILLLAGLMIFSGQGEINARNQNSDKDIKLKMFIHYPKPNVNPGKPTPNPTPESLCQVTTNDQVENYGLLNWTISSVNPVIYQINYSSQPRNLAISQTSLALDNAFNAWEEESGISFIEGSPVSLSRYSLDGVNLISWGNIPSGAIAVTYTWYYPSTGEWVESDTILGRKLKWDYIEYAGDCDGNPVAYDLQNIMTHEDGHWLGLADLYENENSDLTMYGYGVQGELKKDTLGLGDTLGIESIY